MSSAPTSRGGLGFAKGRRDARRLGVHATELREARYMARVATSTYTRAYWLGVAWEGSRP